MPGVQSPASVSLPDVEEGPARKAAADVEPQPSRLHAWWAKWYAGVLFGGALTIVFLAVVIVIVIVSDPVNDTSVCICMLALMRLSISLLRDAPSHDPPSACC